MEVNTLELPAKAEKQYSIFYAPLWPFYYLFLGLRNWAKKHWIISSLLLMFLVVLAFVFRASYQPAFIATRRHIFDIILGLAFIGCFRWTNRALAKREKRFRLIWKVALVWLLVILWRAELYEYMGLYIRYKTLDKKELTTLPTTAEERVQPILSMRTLAAGFMEQGFHPSEPDYVRNGNKYEFTMALEPDGTQRRLGGTVDEVLRIPGQAASPDFSARNRERVCFPIAENMYLGKNTHTATVKTFGLLRFFSYEPGEVRYLHDDAGKMVEVVTLSRLGGPWFSRYIFPFPEFGGVQVIYQSHGGWLHAFHRLFFGEGRWIKPEDIHRYPYLVGQNLAPVEVERYAAKSFRYERGFFAPAPWKHFGDTIIPDMKEDQVTQPFITKVEFGKRDENDKLYGYFALEPYQESRHGLTESVFYPGDNIGPIKFYRHYAREEGLHGVAIVAHQSLGSDIHVDWSHAKTVENLPYIHDIGGSRRLMWKSTLILNPENRKDASASSMPHVQITDARTGRAIWVDAFHPERWINEIEKAMADDR